MKTIHDSRRRLLGLLALALLGGAAACANPVDPEEDEHHPIGLALRTGGTTLASWTVAGPVGNVVVDAGHSVTVEVVALGEDGDLLEIDGEELEVRVGSAEQGITAEIAAADQLTIEGVADGTHQLDLMLYHEGHEEIAASFAVVVE